MEPVEWIIGIVLLIGGVELWDKNKDESKKSPENKLVEIVSNDPVYIRGRYYLTDQGYYITDLTSPPESIEGCSDVILTADLSSPSNDNDKDVVEIYVPCGG